MSQNVDNIVKFQKKQVEMLKNFHKGPSSAITDVIDAAFEKIHREAFLPGMVVSTASAKYPQYKRGGPNTNRNDKRDRATFNDKKILSRSGDLQKTVTPISWTDSNGTNASPYFTARINRSSTGMISTVEIRIGGKPGMVWGIFRSGIPGKVHVRRVFFNTLKSVGKLWGKYAAARREGKKIRGLP